MTTPPPHTTPEPIGDEALANVREMAVSREYSVSMRANFLLLHWPEVDARLRATEARAAQAESDREALRDALYKAECYRDPCPFANPKYEQDLDAACPICGDLGFITDQPSKCVSRPRVQSATAPKREPGTEEVGR